MVAIEDPEDDIVYDVAHDVAYDPAKVAAQHSNSDLEPSSHREYRPAV